MLLVMHRNAVAVAEAAEDRGLRIEVTEYPEGTKTADDAARAIGVEVGQIVKSLVFMVGEAPVLALVSGPNRLDEAKLAAVASADHAAVRRCDADQVRAATGFPIGGVPPFGHPSRLPTFIDENLLRYDVVWAAAGTPRHNFSIAPGDMVRVTGGTVADLKAS
jgi:Cys-tRNA(Pro) deacylase